MTLNYYTNKFSSIRGLLNPKQIHLEIFYKQWFDLNVLKHCLGTDDFPKLLCRILKLSER